MDSFHLKWKSHNLGRAPDVCTIAVLAINHACRLLLGRDDGVTIVGNTNKLCIHTIRINESSRGFHEQLESLTGGLNPVIVFEVHTNFQEINTNAHLAILKYPVGDTRTGNWTERLYQMNFSCNCREAATRLLVMAAVGSGLLAGGFFALLAFLAEEAPWSCISVSVSTSPSTLLLLLLSLLSPSPRSKTWVRGEDLKREWEDSVEIMN